MNSNHLKKGGIALLVEHPPKKSKVGASKHNADKHFWGWKSNLAVDFQKYDCLLRWRLYPTHVSYEIDQARPSDICFIWDGWYSLVNIWVNTLKSACALSHQRKLHGQVSKLDQLVTLQYVAINNHKPSVHITTKLIFDGQGQAAMRHSSEDQLLHHMDKKTEDISWR